MCLGAFRSGATAHGYFADGSEEVLGPYDCILHAGMAGYSQRVSVVRLLYKAYSKSKGRLVVANISVSKIFFLAVLVSQKPSSFVFITALASEHFSQH